MLNIILLKKRIKLKKIIFRCENLKNFKKKYIILGLIFLFCLYNFMQFIHIEINFIELDIKKEILPKFSNQNVNITTPENKTYINPMSGYYLATYGFENDIDGNVPFGWTNSSDFGCGAKINSSLGGHNKVLECWDQSASGSSNIFNYFSPQTSGTVEWWWRQSKSGVAGHIKIGDGPTLRWTITDQLEYDDSGGTPQNVKTVNSNQWYHHKIIFDCNTDTFDWYIDGILEADDAEFRNSRSTLDYFRFYSWTTHQDYSFYLDAVGYSWDPNYNIEENTQEGLLLSYETVIVFNWVGYSLDGQNNQTILGNTTIPVPYDGSHSIQVFGNDSSGIMYQSDVRCFSVDFNPPMITINSPNQNGFSGITAPIFSLSIIEPHLNSTWYTLDDGITNIIFSGLSGTINQTEWNKKGDGSVTILFYANDTLGHIGFANVTVLKDTIAPISSILFIPHEGNNIVNKSTRIKITADDGLGSGASMIKYKINDSDWIDYNGPFTLSSYNFGDYNISYQAIDMAGNVEEAKTILVKLVEIDSFNVVLLIIILIIGLSSGVILGITIVLFINRKRKKETLTPKAPLVSQLQQVTSQEAQKTDITPSICPICGSELSATDKFCKYCGHEL
jgi:hypothetical protein